jgi:hypothetical protein
MFIVPESSEVPHSFRSAMFRGSQLRSIRRAGPTFFLNENATRHRTPKGVPDFFWTAFYKHFTPSE